MPNETQPQPAEGLSRRELVSWLFMGAGLTVSYGLAALYALRFVYPTRRERIRDIFVTTLDELPVGARMEFKDPLGAEIYVQNIGGAVVALSNVCPHLGCKVHWVQQDNRFFCPCHLGAFDISGQPLEGPPKAENKWLKRYETVTRGNAVYIRWKETVA
ncbi:MAG: Rieske (2Fe-2S) protein [Planctomycetes bacterium]|nr:Rieske (2Fe-2S) protein [Planctomycetota bacterium]